VPQFEVGDVVRWHWPSNPSYVQKWQKEYGQDPLVVVKIKHYEGYCYEDDHPILVEVGTGKPVKRGEAVNRQVFVKDEFLTAVYRASGNINKQPKPKQERTSE
jgi:hypothetical protein